MTNNNENTSKHDLINELARKAAAGTLKKIHTMTGNKRIFDYMNALQADFNIFDNNNDHNALKSISDSYDIYLVAYEYLFDMIVNQGFDAQDTITITLKNGKEKTRTVFQWACVKVRQYIYENKSIENTGKFTYIEDLSNNTDESDGITALDKIYLRMDKYNGINTYNDYINYHEIMKELKLSDMRYTIVKMRMRGMSVTAIAQKLGVSHPAISKQLIKVQNIINEKMPELVRGFKQHRGN